MRSGAMGLLILASASCYGFFIHINQAVATLGGSADSVEIDRAAIKAVRRSSSIRSDHYTVQEVLWGATTIREFVNASGVVFAVTWVGLRHPDLSKLMGNYYDEYHREAEGPKRGRGPRAVKSANVVVRFGGHMRRMRGKAYIPALVPSGVDVNELQ